MDDIQIMLDSNKIKISWENDKKSIMRIVYYPGYTWDDYVDLLNECVRLIDENNIDERTLVYLNVMTKGMRYPKGNPLPYIRKMTRTFDVNAMIMVYTDMTQVPLVQSFAKMFNFVEGKNFWLVDNDEQAVALAYHQQKILEQRYGDAV